MNTPDLFFIAGEPSGDFHGKNLLQALKKKSPELKIAGIGGPHLRATDFTSLLPMEEFQVMGFSDVLGALPKLVKNFFKIRNAILEMQPKAVIFIDYPD